MAQPSPLLALPSMAGHLEKIESTLRASVVTEDDYLTEIASHLITAGGKRIRPVLAVASALTAGEATEEVIRGGVAVELVHLGSLYHDDVIDEAETRRGIPSVNSRWGNLRAILAGDFLLARASEIAASLGTEVAGLLANTIGRLCHGEISQLRTAFDVRRTQADYFEATTGKTASLFSTACRIGAIVADLSREQIAALTTYGANYGMVFQLVDDVLDLTATEEQLGKPAGHDLVEGVYTLPVIDTVASGGAAAEELCARLGGPIGGDDHERALAIVRSNGGVGAALGAAGEYAVAARRALDAIEPSPVRDALAVAPDVLIAGAG
jgi:heptaprenyl diphosphate synthase